MEAQIIQLDEKHIRSFTTKDLLTASAAYKALSTRGIRHLIIRVESGRWTAIFFPSASLVNEAIHCQTGKRFMVIA